jgi:mannose-6-phosphate isomerase-like protein (cupin superfamily)
VRREQISTNAKGWFAGPWDSDLAVSIGFANEGVDEPHVHSRITEVYLVSRGSATIRVENSTIELREAMRSSSSQVRLIPFWTAPTTTFTL